MKWINFKHEPENAQEALMIIEKLTKANQGIQEYLHYADHGAYSQEKNRIQSNQDHIYKMKGRIRDNNYA